MIYPTVPFPVTLSDPQPRFQGHEVIIDAVDVLCAQLTLDLFAIAKYFVLNFANNHWQPTSQDWIVWFWTIFSSVTSTDWATYVSSNRLFSWFSSHDCSCSLTGNSSRQVSVCMDENVTCRACRPTNLSYSLPHLANTLPTCLLAVPV